MIETLYFVTDILHVAGFGDKGVSKIKM